MNLNSLKESFSPYSIEDLDKNLPIGKINKMNRQIEEMISDINVNEILKEIKERVKEK